MSHLLTQRGGVNDMNYHHPSLGIRISWLHFTNSRLSLYLRVEATLHTTKLTHPYFPSSCWMSGLHYGQREEKCLTDDWQYISLHSPLKTAWVRRCKGFLTQSKLWHYVTWIKQCQRRTALFLLPRVLLLWLSPSSQNCVCLFVPPVEKVESES